MPTFPDPDARPVPPGFPGEPGSGLPSAVRYARGLLWLQGAIWALLALGFAVPTLAGLADVLAGHRTWFAAAVGWLPAVAALTGGFAMTKILLARRLGGGQERIRKVVIGAEISMTCLGVLITAGVNPAGGLPAGFLALAAVTGGGLSLAAAMGLMRRESRRYFAGPGVAANAATDDHVDGNAGYCAVRPATVITRLRWGARAAACQA